ncbi:MAG TPA: UrcA family protein [Caulobacteraceae bacterium]|nr:UrcA family protein [Caulobacteraceae bacterium]
MSLKIIVTTIAVMGSLAYAVGSHAGPASDPDTVSVKVSLAGLDMESHAGGAIALRRITGAATIICGEARSPMELDRAHQACMKATVDRAVQSLGNPIVAALNGGHRDLATFLASR